MTTNFLTDCVFHGLEAEGPDRGILTLFIATHYMNPSKILRYLRKRPKIRRVYFGAGGKYGLPSDYFELADFLIRNRYKVLVEVNRMGQIHIMPDKLRDRLGLQIVMVFTMDGVPIRKNFSRYAQYVSVFKFVDETEVLWCPVDHANKRITYLDNPFYKKDKKVNL